MADVDRAGIHRVLARQKVVALVAAALVLIGTGLFAAAQRPVYQSTASVGLLPGSGLDTLGAYESVVTRLLPLYATKVGSQTFLDRVARREPSLAAGGPLDSELIARPDPAAAVLDLVVRDENPRRAAALAQAALDQFLSETKDTTIVSFEVLDRAAVPRSPVFPRRELILGSSVFLALLVAVGAAVVWDRLFHRIHELQELRLPGGPRVLGALPASRRLRRSRSALFAGDPRMASADKSLRGIRTVLTRPGRPIPAMVTITALRPGVGTSTFTANLAVLVAELGLRVLVVDTDLGHPRQHEIFGVSNERGLSSVVEGTHDVGEALQPTRFPRVSLLAAGPPSQRQGDTVDLYLHGIPRLRKHADLVIVDAPSLSADADVGLLAAVTDGVVLLVRAGSTTTRQLQTAIDGLDALDVPMLGLVLTMSSGRAVSYEAYSPDLGPRPGRDRWPSGVEVAADRDEAAWDPPVPPVGRPSADRTPTDEPSPPAVDAPTEPERPASAAETRAGYPSSLIADLRVASRREGSRSERPRDPGTA